MKSKFIALGLVLLLFTGFMLAQSDRATITGTVKDSTGAVIPDAQVTVINDATNVKTPTTTNSLGIYTVRNLPIGSYRVQVAKTGFGSFERKGITLLISQVAEIDIELKVGTTAELVTVTEDAAVLQ